ncbi:MAG TPA: hypothetical protein VMV68_01400 [Spirochaetia bacterium]|nr:hypothetical protein [Spirochaetia bacterium]
MAATKVYDYKPEKVKNKVVAALKKRKLESTVADLVAGTGLPTNQVQESIKAVADEYRGQMRVTESGEILYYFPSGMRSRLKGFGPTLRRVLRKVGSTSARILSFLFKIWIMVMLVGYFVIFVGLLLLAMLASVAASAASQQGGGNRSRSRDGFGFGGFFLMTRVIEIFIQIWLYSSLVKGEQRQRARRRPLHRSVFSYVFGDGDPNPDWDTAEKKAIIHYIQGNKGILTLEELMALTGYSHERAQELLNAYLIEFEGSPEVTNEGTLYYRFAELMKTRDLPTEPQVRSAPSRALYAFSSNKPGANRWITFFNGFNLVFGAYFLYFGTFVPVIPKTGGLGQFYLLVAFLASRYLGLDPNVILPVVLGAIPFAFSLLFFLVPIVRRAREKAKNEEIKKTNLRRRLFDRILQNPLYVDPMKLEPVGAAETPKGWEGVRDQSLKQFAAMKRADVEDVGQGNYLYKFVELDREEKDIAQLRNSVDISKYNIGKTIFDSGE